MRISGRRLWLWLLAVSLFSVACEEVPPTEVFVEIDAERSVKRLATKVRIKVEGGEDLDELGGRTTRHEETADISELPLVFRLTPMSGDENRAFVITATALTDGDELVSQARLISSYIPRQSLRPKLMIQGGDCLQRECSEETDTCFSGFCVSAKIAPKDLPNDNAVEFPEGGPLDAEMDAEHDAAPDAGPDAEPDATPSLPDTGPDAAEGGPSGDGGLGSACPNNGMFQCLGANSIGVLACSGNVWQQATSCKVTERCDSRASSTQGYCLDVVKECAEKMPGDQVCRGNQRLTCGPDRVSVETVDCPMGQVCVQTGNQTSCMEDADECAQNTDDCDDQPNACRNTLSTFACECPAGYTGNGKGTDGCMDVDECAAGAQMACRVASATCMNSAGSYACTCPSGYSGTGSKACLNIDECANGAVAACRAGATGCMDTPGSYQCTCGAGYNGTGTTSCSLANTSCSAGAAAACGVASATCTQSGASYTCTCPSGYTGTGTTGCTETNECLAGALSACGVGSASCANTPLGSYTCTCPSGYTGTGTTRCADRNECDQGAATTCGVASATCNNTAGSYTCTCPSGYSGTGSQRCTMNQPVVAPRPECMVWVSHQMNAAVPSGRVVEGGFELSFSRYPDPPATNRHFVCQVDAGGVRYPAKLSENPPNRTWGCYAHNGSAVVNSPYRVLTLASTCSTSWVSAGTSLPTNAVVAGDNGSAHLVPCMAHVSTASPTPFPLDSGDPASAHPNDTHLGWVSSAGPHRCRYEYVGRGFEASTFQVLVWNQ